VDISFSKFLEAPDISSLKGEYLLRRFGVTFTYGAMTDRQLSEYQNACMKSEFAGKKGSSKKSMLDFGKFKKMVIANHVIEPNIADPEFLKKGGWALPEEFIDAKLTPGEVLDLYQGINNLSGFEDSLDDDIEEAKN
jgi:hypothetical protein